MAEHAFREDGISYVISPTDVMTGDRNRRMQLYYQLIQSISGAKRIDIIVSFLIAAAGTRAVHILWETVSECAGVHMVSACLLPCAVREGPDARWASFTV